MIKESRMRLTMFIFLSFLVSFSLTQTFIQAQENTNPSAPSGFCQTKTDYDPQLTCSNKYFNANNKEELESYLGDFGRSKKQYKNLRIRFALTDRSISIHSPCSILTGEGLTHTAQNICLDGKKGVRIGKYSFFDANKIHILSHEGDSIIEKSTVIKGKELEIYSSGKLHFHSGVRVNLKGHARLVSTLQDKNVIAFRMSPFSVLKGNNLTVLGNRKINFNNSVLNSKNKIRIHSLGNTSFNHVRVTNNGKFVANNIRIEAGNSFKIQNKAVFNAKNRLHISAKGCFLTDDTKLTYGTKTGSCLIEKNIMPIAVIDASTLLGKTPLSITFDASSSSDSDGDIESYLWTFSDGMTLAGETIQRDFTQAGTYTVTLTVTDNDGAEDMAEVVVNVTTPLSPFAIAEVTPLEGEVPLTINLDGSNSTDPDGEIVSFEWIFDDGEILTGEMQTRTFDSAGTYTVSLKVTDIDGLTHQTEAIDITVNAMNNLPMMIADQSFTVRPECSFNIYSSWGI